MYILILTILTTASVSVNSTYFENEAACLNAAAIWQNSTPNAFLTKSAICVKDS